MAARKVGPKEWKWRRYILGEGEFKQFGPQNRAHRPKDIPECVGAWCKNGTALWRPSLKAFQAKRKIQTSKPPQVVIPPYRGILNSNGTWLRNPRGGVEDVAEMFFQGNMKWVGYNLNKGDWYEPNVSNWNVVRYRAAQMGMPAIPWLRVRTRQDVQHLRRTAEQDGAPALGLNLEKEAEDVLLPSECAEILRGFSGEIFTFMEAWLYNSTDWHPLAAMGPVILQIFPVESAAAHDPEGCIIQARKKGFAHVFLAYGAYGGMKPSQFDLTRPHSIYCGDDVGNGNWHRWS